jgi:biofilm PGA synthesis N-glycosyltransferase PgaC
VVYTYVGYPTLIGLASVFKGGNPDLVPPLDWPTVTIIVPVHNEEKYIQSKIENLREIDYPQKKLKICFSSDGSEDGTDELIRQHTDVELVSYSPRKGKPSAINECVPSQESEILVFTDARQTIDPKAIKKLVARLLQPGIGAVSGELVHLDPETKAGKSIGLYWKYEKWIRKAESNVHSVAGVTGALYAIYRKDFKPIPKDTLLDDFEVPINLLQNGMRILIESGAFIYDSTQEDAAIEKKRKIRTLTGNYQSFLRNRWLFSFRRNPIWWQFISHKVFRLVVPYALAILLVTSIFLTGWIYNLMVIAQAVFYCLALIGRFISASRSIKLVSFSYVFFELNLAVVQALIQYLQNPIDAKWEKTT